MKNKSIDFDKITPCGGCCDDCEHKQAGTCAGCRANQGKCVKMWENGCDIYQCCVEHEVLFCGLCGEFPCPWIVEEISRWNPEGIKNLSNMARIYREKGAANAEE